MSVSTDGENFVEVASQQYDVQEKAENTLTDIMLSFQETSARYIRLNVIPLERIPQWRSENGGTAYVFIDEVIVL